MMSPNSSGVCSWPRTSTVAATFWSIGFGCADAAGGHLGVLRGNGGGDVVGGEVEAEHPVRVEPDPHRPRRGEDLCAADAVDPPDLADDVAVEIVAEPDDVDRAVGGDEADHHQETRAGLLDLHALLGHHLRQA